MKLIVSFLLCFVTVTWQQYVYWPSPRPTQWHYPFRYHQNYDNLNPIASMQRSGLSHHYRRPNANNYETYHMPGRDQIVVDDQLMSINQKSNDYYDENEMASPKFFGLGYLSYKLIANALSSRSRTASQSTKYTTSVSVVTANSIAVCYTSTMFSTTAGCRRKRIMSDDRLDIGQFHDEAPTQHESEPVLSVEVREKRDVNIESSRQEHDISEFPVIGNAIRQERQIFSSLFSTAVTTTSTITSYSVTTSVSTSTNTNLGGESSLSCVPSGFTLC